MNKTHTSGSTKQLLRVTFRAMRTLLEDAFASGFSAGYHSEDNPASHAEDWEDYKKEHLSEYEVECTHE